MFIDPASSCATLSVLFAGYAIAEWANHVRENRLLRVILCDLFGDRWNGRIESRDQLLVIKRYLGDRIRPGDEPVNKRRPVLRHSAVEILAAERGFCGENARVAIRLLSLGGLRARRIYLWSHLWGHVACEFWWDGTWKLFDSYHEPDFEVSEDAIGLIDSNEFEKYPNQTRENPWVEMHRLKFARGCPVLSHMSRMKLPYPLCGFVESPSMIRCGFSGLLAVLSALLACSYQA
jgi:hypothetical protein